MCFIARFKIFAFFLRGFQSPKIFAQLIVFSIIVCRRRSPLFDSMFQSYKTTSPHRTMPHLTEPNHTEPDRTLPLPNRTALPYTLCFTTLPIVKATIIYFIIFSLALELNLSRLCAYICVIKILE